MNCVPWPAMDHQGDIDIVVLSGLSGCGKTTICAKIVELGRQSNLSLDGLLTLPRYLDGIKMGLEVRNIGTGETRPLAETGGTTDGPSMGRFRFYSAGVDWGNDALNRIRSCDLFILDELGPLELKGRQGWHVGLDVLRSKVYRLAVVVVRPVLVERFENLMGGMRILKLDVTQDNRDELPGWILDLCERQKENADGRFSGGA